MSGCGWYMSDGGLPLYVCEEVHIIRTICLYVSEERSGWHKRRKEEVEIVTARKEGYEVV